jgi:hypothetical protein
MRVGRTEPSGCSAEAGTVHTNRAVIVPLPRGIGDGPGPVPLFSTLPGPPSPVR